MGTAQRIVLVSAVHVGAAQVQPVDEIKQLCNHLIDAAKRHHPGSIEAAT
jgi:hypothetical protein